MNNLWGSESVICVHPHFCQALEIHFFVAFQNILKSSECCIRCGPDEERILDVVSREDVARNSC